MPEAKYVIFKDMKGKEFAVLFSPELAHKEVADGLRHEIASSDRGGWSKIDWRIEPVSAGFIGSYDDSRESESLNMGPRPQDKELLTKLIQPTKPTEYNRHEHK